MDIEQLIRQRAEERGVNPDVAVSIAKAESSMIPGAKNPKSSARGLFQVTNDTWKEHGGDPKKRGDINEDIRVGLEVIARNTRSMRDVLGQEPQPRHIYAAHFFGPTGARRMLSADPNAQVAKVMSSQVMRANKEMLEGRTVAQALQELGRKVGDVEPKQEGVAQRGTVVTDPVTGELRRVPSVARPVDGGYREDPANPPVISRAIEATRDLGPGYQAALALSYLADTEESSDDENDASIVEREAAQEVATMTAPRSNAAQMLANMDFGFAPVVTQRQPQQPQQEPVQMFMGGLVSRIRGATTTQSQAPAPNFTPEEVAQIRRGLTEQGFKEPPRTASSRATGASGIFGRVPFRLFQALRTKIGPNPNQLTAAELQALYGTTGLDPQMVAPAPAPSGRSSGTGIFSNGAFRNIFSRLAGREQSTVQQVPQFGLTQELIDAKRAQLRGTERELGFGEVMPEGFDAYKARFPTLATFTPGTVTTAPGPTEVAPSTLQMLQQSAPMPQNVLVPTGSIMDVQNPVRLAQGGEVADPYAQLMQGAPRTRVSPGQFVRGGFDTAAGMLKGATQAAAGTFGDIESLVRMGVGSERGAVLPTTDDVKRTLDRFAPLNLPTAEGTDGRTAAEYFGEFMSPAAATRPLVRGAQAMGEGAVEGFRRAEAALEEPVGRILDRGGMSAEMLKAFGSPPSYAIRPPGGNVFPEQIEKIVAGPDVQRTLSNLPADRIDDVTEFLATKGRKYFQKDYASTKDPLYDALKEGRILPLTDTTQFRGYMIDAAREGNPQALEDLARNYDMAVEPTIITRPMPEGGSRADQLVQENEIIARLTRNLQEAPGAVLPMERRVPERYDLLRLQENVERFPLGRSLTPEELRSVERGDPFYKLDKTFAIPTFMRPDSIAKELAEIPADRLKNMSYPEAVIAINQPARFRADWGAAVKRAEQGKDVPKDVKMFGLSPEPVAKGDRGAWHQLRDPRSTQMESAFMGHSVKDYFQGSESYGLGGPEAFRSGRAKVYSLRDSKGNPRVTVEVLDTPEGMEVTQVKGRYNAGPRESEVNDVFKLFDELNTGGKLRNIRRELYLPNEKAPPDALTGGTEWKTLYDEYRQTKQ